MNLDICEVKSNCKTFKTECWSCENYSLYYPINKKIKCQRQIKNKEDRKNDKKLKADRIKMGRRNKRSGKQAEKNLETLLNSWGFIAKRVPMSGALKATNFIGASDLNLSGDLILEYGDDKFRIEVKKRADLNTMYKLIDTEICIVGSSFRLIKEEEFRHLLLIGSSNCKTKEVEDVGFKKVHDWFRQDDSDIVAMKSNYKEWIFAIKESVYVKFFQ